MNTQALSLVHAAPVDTASAPSLKPRLERLTAALVDSESRLACIRRDDGNQARIDVCERLLREVRTAIESMPAWHADEREFFAWDCVGQFAWMQSRDVLAQAIGFRVPVYRRVFSEFAQWLGSLE